MKYRYITRMGELFRLSEKQYLRLLKDGSESESFGNVVLWNYGAKHVADEVTNITDLNADGFAYALKCEQEKG
jgi:hypothetical protein